MRTNIADNTLFLEMLGKGNGTEVFTTAAQTSKDWYCVFFPIDSVITTIAGNATNITALNGQTMKCWDYIVSSVSTAITLASGIGIGYPRA